MRISAVKQQGAKQLGVKGACFLGALVLATMPTSLSAGSGDLFVFELSGEQENPPTPTAATGGCMGVLDELAAEFTLACAHDVVGANGAHIHVGAVGVDGPIVFNLGNPATPIENTWTGMTPTDISDLRTGSLYVNVHSPTHPGGEIRGQIFARTVDHVTFSPDGGQQVPPNASTATASCFADLSDDATTLAAGCSHDVFMPIEAHIHRGAVGINGVIVFNFGDPTSPFAGIMPVTPVDVAHFVGQFFYVNIHSVAFPTGEIRGQIAGGIFADGFESGDTSAWSATTP
jgi:hypothetical protein